MRILIIGAGLSGASFAAKLSRLGHCVEVREQLPFVGGLCYSDISPNGIIYEPFGARTFHTKFDYVKEFVLQFADFNSYVHRKGAIIDGQLVPFPISRHTIDRLSQKKKIYSELEKRSGKIDTSDFETCMKSMLGNTLYKLFIENYTKVMWGIEPKNLSAEWAPKRLEFRQGDDDSLFEEQWQGLPIGGYTKFIENMLKFSKVDLDKKFDPNHYDMREFDLILFSGKIDSLLNYKFGKLPYRSLEFSYTDLEEWEKDNYGTINLPQHPNMIRKANFKILHQQKTEKVWIQYQKPVEASEKNLPMYPVNTISSKKLFRKYLNEIIKKYPNIVPIGRLGLFKYLDMDKAVKLALDMTPLVLEWRELDTFTRLAKINDLLKEIV